MPKRVQSHELEGKSLLALQNRLPPPWVFRPEHPDYGIDGSIEVFSPNGEATGLRCALQVKATSKSPRVRSVRIRRDTAAYYRRIDTPVLIALYVDAEDALYVRWFHEFDPYYGGVGKKWITFRFETQDRWTADTPHRIEKDLEAFRVLRNAKAFPLPIPFWVEVQEKTVGGISRGRLRTAMRRRLETFPRIFEHNWDGVLRIQVNDQVIKAGFRGGRFTSTLHTRGRALALEEYCDAGLMLCAMAIGNAGDHGLAWTLANTLKGSRLMKTPEAFATISRSMTAAHQTGRALELGQTMIDDEQIRPIVDGLLVGAMFGLTGEDRDNAQVEQHLRWRIAYAETNEDQHAAAVSHYNLGNYLRGQARFSEALGQYRKACELHPGYRQRDYVCREVAGTLFGLGFYTKAARFYKYALERGGEPSWRALRADALMFAGRFKDANDEFGRYLETTEKPEAEWIMKHWVVSVLLERGVQDGRDTKGARALTDKEDASAKQSSEETKKALTLDPLNVTAWLRSAADYREEGAHSEAGQAAMIAAVLARNDARLWAQAFVLGTANDDLLAGLASPAFAAMDAVGQRFAEAVQDLVRGTGVSEEVSDGMVELLDQLEESYKIYAPPPDAPLIRMSGHGADYEKIDIRDLKDVAWGKRNT